MRVLLVLLVLGVPGFSLQRQGGPRKVDDRYMHPCPKKTVLIKDRMGEGEFEEAKAQFWRTKAQSTLRQKLLQRNNENIAKNVILFLGDGMSIPTLAATRIYLGGSNEQLSFEKFPYTALSKTYCVDFQVADSACSATAYLCGVKANLGTVGVTAAVELNDCPTMLNSSNHVDSIARWSQLKGKKTGLVTTTRVTHASPSGVYAHTANRNWESDTDILDADLEPTTCRDIAHQLLYNEAGKNLNVILGGGRSEFLPDNVTDNEGEYGARSDNRNLIEEWQTLKRREKKKAKYVYNRSQLLTAADSTDYLLGLFGASHVAYNLDRNKNSIPSLAEMTESAIKVLSRNSRNGYFLFVEGGRIDHAHHDTLARKSLDETAEFSKAIQRAVDLTSEEDTLIVVTSDHAHTMSVSGYPERTNSIFGTAGNGSDDIPYLTINYATGPGYKADTDEGRYDVSGDNTKDKEYRFPSVAPLESETHGGDDVGIFARGPWSHLFSGVIEENVIPHILAYASCVGEGETACEKAHGSHGTDHNHGEEFAYNENQGSSYHHRHHGSKYDRYLR